MNLALDLSLAEGYKSPAQRARRITEGWFERNMYCPACPAPRLARTRENTPVVDFVCASCGAEYQVKAKGSAWGRRLRDAAFGPMIERAAQNRSPHFAFVGYDRKAWRVERLLLVPGHFITPDAIEECKPLSSSARRAGWVGCNILMHRIPTDGRLAVISECEVLPASTVRRAWERFSWLSELTGKRADRRGWAVDVLRCVRSFGKREFALDEVYAFEEELAALHPANRHVRPKIRQQLQVLRDRGIIRFLGRGRYVAE